MDGSNLHSNQSSLVFHPSLPRLATLGEADTVIRIWELDMDVLLGQSAADSVRYTTAKLVLVGDSGVGKTGLGWRLAHNEFKEHASTHGQQFWVVDDLCTTRADGTECEAVLWDLAGQHIYRPIHAIFLDDVDASLVLFDPTNRQEPLKGAEFWLEQLAHKKNLPPSVLVGARLDRGASTLSKEELTQFCQKHGISGGYIGTSAKEGHGLDNLLETLKKQIPWDEMTTTVTTRTFKRVKDYVLSLKEKPDRKGVLVSPAELRHLLETSEVSETSDVWTFTDAEMMTAVGHLANHGYVAVLQNSSSDEHILLTPELLVDLASSIVLQADKHPRELGALNETELLQGRYPLPELNDLETDEQQILLDAAVMRFLKHNICFRETLGNDTLLIFPSLIKQKRPLHDEVEAVDDISYIVRGRVENIYPALVVLLGFTRTFTRVNQWQRQAQYEMGVGNICGFRLIEDLEGEIELVLYYSSIMPEFGRYKFQGLFEEFLYQRDVKVTRFPPVRCPDDHLQERSTVVKRVRERKQFLFCEECGEKINLPDIEKQPKADPLEADWIQREEALARLRSTYETLLTRVKGFRRDRAAPRCYLSHLPAQAVWVAQLADDLRDAGVHVLTDREKLADDDLILMADTPTYQQNFKANNEAIAADAALIRSRWKQSRESTVIRLLAPNHENPPALAEIKPYDFRRDSHYAVSLFDLVLTLYAIPHNHQAFAPLRKSLHQQWEQKLAGIGEFVEIDEAQARQNRAQFLQLLNSYFKQNELETLCFDLGIDFENLPGNTKEEKARELMLFCEREDRIHDLQEAVRERRPHIEWPNI
ncbi:GTP-binding protein [Candidatus Leptofilum sp.]|uniref:GTP-binding protein n=1 Tax=Candidatus Leptofilum sp. TaxID=3241576 RepID=UPI003B59CD52